MVALPVIFLALVCVARAKDTEYEVMVNVTLKDGSTKMMSQDEVNLKNLEVAEIIENMVPGGKGEMYQEQSGSMSMEDASSGVENPEVFRMVYRANMSLAILQHHGYVPSGYKLASMQTLSEDEVTELGVEKGLIPIIRGNEYRLALRLSVVPPTDADSNLVPLDFLLDIESDKHKYRYPGLAILNAWLISNNQIGSPLTIQKTELASAFYVPMLKLLLGHEKLSWMVRATLFALGGFSLIGGITLMFTNTSPRLGTKRRKNKSE